MKIYKIQVNYCVRTNSKESACRLVEQAIKMDCEDKGKLFPFPFEARICVFKTIKSQLTDIWNKAHKKK